MRTMSSPSPSCPSPICFAESARDIQPVVPIKPELQALSSCIEDKPPYYCGTLSLPPSEFLLYYGKDASHSR